MSDGVSVAMTSMLLEAAGDIGGATHGAWSLVARLWRGRGVLFAALARERSAGRAASRVSPTRSCRDRVGVSGPAPALPRGPASWRRRA